MTATNGKHLSRARKLSPSTARQGDPFPVENPTDSSSFSHAQRCDCPFSSCPTDTQLATMDSPPAVLSSPTKALNPVSPERMNQQTVMSPSPSRSSDAFRSHHRKGSRGSSDVQSKVAFLNNLARGNSPAPASPVFQSTGNTSTVNPAALQRALLGREEAESALQTVSTQLSEAQSRERRINERLESLTEDLQAAKERQSNERSVFEKEIKKVRKEAFRAGSAVIKIQEDLKQARAEAKALKDEVQAEREAKDQANQDAFERAYALAGLTEESEVLKERLRAAETSNHSHTLEARAHDMRKDDIGRLSLAEGDLAMLLTPTPRRPKRSAEDSATSPLMHLTNDSSTQCTPPKRPRLSDYTPQQKEQNTAKLESQRDQLEELQQLLEHEKQRRINAEEMMQFMQLECQFKRCSCRLAEDAGHDHSSESPRNGEKVTRVEHANNPQNARPSRAQKPQAHTRESMKNSQRVAENTPVHAKQDSEAQDDVVVTFSPETGTFRTIPSPEKSQERPTASSRLSSSRAHRGEESVAQSDPRDLPFGHHSVPAPSRPHPFTTPSPSTAMGRIPQGRLSVDQSAGFEADTSGYPITKRVPLRTDESRLSGQSAVIPGTPVSREQALAQIRARRGRANSMKRSVSAGESIMQSAPPPAPSTGSAHRTSGVQPKGRSESDTGFRRDMSAPVRSYRR